MPKRKLRNLPNLETFSNYKKLPTYKKTKPQDKENVSNITLEACKLTALTGNPPIGHDPSFYEA